MNKNSLGGLVLAGVGLLLFLLGGTGFAHREELFRIGDFRASATTNRPMPALRYLGVAMIGGGVVLLVMGLKRGGK
jgi:hypothetical protein